MIHGVKIYPGFFKAKPVERELHYYSVSESRRMQSEYPIGDHLGGPAYGLRAMPVVAVIAAIGSFTAGAAIATAAGATLGAMVVGGAMMVGAAMTVVGAVTGNQKLMKVGGILSLAGGVGAIGMEAMGMLSTGAEAMAGAGELASVGEAGGAGMGITEAANATSGLPVSPMAGPSELATVGESGGGMLSAPGAGQIVDDAARSELAGTVGKEAATTATSAAPLTQEATGMLGTQGPNAFAGQGPNAFVTNGTKSTGFFDKAGNWVTDNKDMTKMLVDTAGGIAKSVPSPKDKAEQALLAEKQKELERRRTWWSGPRGGA